MVGSAGSKVSHTQNWEEKRGFGGIIMDASNAAALYKMSSGLLCAATNQATIQTEFWSFFIHRGFSLEKKSIIPPLIDPIGNSRVSGLSLEG